MLAGAVGGYRLKLNPPYARYPPYARSTVVFEAVGSDGKVKLVNVGKTKADGTSCGKKSGQLKTYLVPDATLDTRRVTDGRDLNPISCDAE